MERLSLDLLLSATVTAVMGEPVDAVEVRLTDGTHAVLRGVLDGESPAVRIKATVLTGENFGKRIL